MRVHLEGMGLTGCLLAWQLERAGVDFTWHDNDEAKTAWRACTGAIYPGGGIDRGCYDWWQENIIELENLVPNSTEPAGYWFNHKQPPHDGDYEVIRRVVGVAPRGVPSPQLSLSELHSWHVCAQTLVPALRERYAARNVLDGTRAAKDAISGTGTRYVVAHGFGQRMHHAYWGWTRHVELELDPQLGIDSTRSAFYFRKGRFVMAYAYPVPGTPYWYAGSSLLWQRADRLKSLTMPAKYERWRAQFEELSGGLVRVRVEHAYIEGWRPSRDEETDPFRVKVRAGRVLVPPLWNSGLRHFPRVWSGVAAALGVPDCSLTASPAPSP